MSFRAGGGQVLPAGATSPRPYLAACGELLRDYCARNDLACQRGANSTVDGHVSYFTNDMRAHGVEFILKTLTPRSSVAAYLTG